MSTRGLNLAKTVSSVKDNHESKEDCISSAEGVALANGTVAEEVEDIVDETSFLRSTNIREGASELLVITKMKKLASYIITVTEKSPKKFRAVFVNRLQNYCLDCLEHLFEANSLRRDSAKNKELRKVCQHKAYLKMKLIGYISFLALESGCILKKQYQQISLQNADCINLLVAWRKSDSKT